MCHNIFHGKGCQTCHILYLSIMCHNIFHGKCLGQTCHILYLSIMCHNIFHGKCLGQTCHTVPFYYVSQHISWQGFVSDMSYIVPFYYVSQHISWQVFGSDMSYCTFLLCVTTYFMARVWVRHVILYLSIMCHNIFHCKCLGQTCHTVLFYYVSQHILWQGFGSDMSYCTFLLCVTTYFMASVWVRHVILYFSIMCHNIFHGKCLGQTCHTVLFYYVSQHISWQGFGSNMSYIVLFYYVSQHISWQGFVSDMSYCTFVIGVRTSSMKSIYSMVSNMTVKIYCM